MEGFRIIDGDGHIMEDVKAISRFLPAHYKESISPHRLTGLFPAFDHFHQLGSQGKSPEGGFAYNVGPEEWLDFMERLSIETAVLYPTLALGFYKITDLDWAIDVARAYNDWLYENYVKRSSRFVGIGLIPVQDIEAGVEELRRIVEKLGMSGAMLGPNSLAAHFGSKGYWPVYQEADRLGCALALHGACHNNFGMNDLNVYAGIQALGHPFGQLINFTSMVLNGIFDKFPNVRFGFMEAGVAWFLMALERCDGAYRTFIPPDPRGRLLKLEAGESVRDYILRHVKEGRIFIGCEGDEPDLAYAVRMVGREPFVFSSDFPHEVNTDTCREEIQEILASEGLTAEDKKAILYDNAKRFYRLGATSPRK